MTAASILPSTDARAAAATTTGGVPPRAAIVGGSLGGLAAAHALSRNGWNVDVMERSPQELRNKGSGLGFVHVPLWETLTQRPMIRRQRRASRAQGSFYYGDLWGYLHDGLDSESVKVHFGKSVEEIKGTVQMPVIDNVLYDLVVVADGGFSKLRHYVFDEVNHEVPQPDYAGYVVWRGGISASKLSDPLRKNIRHLEGVYKDGIYDTIVLKMAKDNGEDVWTFGTFVATPEEELPSYGWNKLTDGKARHHGGKKASVIPDWFLPHMSEHFHRVPGLVPLIEEIIKKGELQPHPQYEFGNIDKIHNGRILILGDAAHMASPRTASGAHTAVLDAFALYDAFAESGKDTTTDIDAVLQRYSRDGMAHAKQLYARTREVSRDFVPR